MPHPLLPSVLTAQLGLDPGASLMDFDIDGVLRPLLAVGLASVSEEAEQAPHQHRKGQLLYATRGVIHCEVDSGVWIVPPQCAVWIPGGLMHSAQGVGEAQCYCLFVEPAMAPALPTVCCTVAVSPLLPNDRPGGSFPTLATLHGAQERLVLTLLDDSRPRPWKTCICRCHAIRVCAAGRPALAQPAIKHLGRVASRIGMSERSMTGSHWRNWHERGPLAPECTSSWPCAHGARPQREGGGAGTRYETPAFRRHVPQGCGQAAGPLSGERIGKT